MNTRFKLFLINSLNQRRFSRHSGFALPLAVMIGLCIIVVGLSVVMQAQGNQSKVISQKAKASSMAAAETGLTRIQNVFASAKFAALYNGTDWATAIAADGTPIASAGGTTNATGDALSSQLTAVANSSVTACGTSSDVVTKTTAIKNQLAQLRTLAVAGATTYQPIDSKNSYRLVSYQYAGTSGQMPNGTAIGRLTIEGKSNDGGSDSVSRIMVDIPISGTATTNLPSNGFVPGLWVKDGGIDKNWESSIQTSVASASDNYQFASSVAFSDCGANKLTDSYVSDVQNQITSTGKTAAKTSLVMPSVPPIPTGITPATLSSSSLGNNKNNVTDFTASAFPAPVGSDGFSYYKVTGDLDGYMSVPTGRKVKIYVTGDIDVSLQHSGDTTNVQILGQKASGGTICMNGNDATNINAFILAPTYDAGKTGSGQLSGSLFVKSWGKASCMSSNSTVAMVQTQTWADIPDDLKPASVPSPTIAAISGWTQMDITASVPAPPAPVTSP
jgi:hypothetical protein